MDTMQNITDGGIQTVIPQLAESNGQPQIIYLDFDGAVTSYRNDQLGVYVDNVVVSASQFTDTDISAMVDSLNQSFGGDVIFTATKPNNTAEYSTVYIGKTTDFSDIGTGNYLGLAESIDPGNKIRNDNAFVMLDADSSTPDETVEVIIHEVNHIVSGTTHAGSGLDAYATGIICVSSGEVAHGQVLSDASQMSVYGHAIGTTVNSMGALSILSGGIATRTTVNSSGTVHIFSSGTATDTTVNFHGYMYVSSGGTAIAIKENGGHVEISNYASATFVPNSFSGLVFSSFTVTVHSGTTAVNTTIDIDARMAVYSGGHAIDTVVKNGGYLYTEGCATGTILTSTGYQIVSSGGTSIRTTVNTDSELILHSGGTAVGTTNSGHTLVYGGGVAIDTTIFGGYMAVCYSGIANNTGITSGNMVISQGGFATATTLNSAGSLRIRSGGTAAAIKENGGSVEIEDGATTTFVPNSFSGLVLAYRAANSATLHSGTTAVSTTINTGGRLDISSGGTAIDTAVNSGGDLYISSGATAKGITLNSGCHLSISSGAIVSNVIINKWCGLSIRDLTIHDITVNSGGSLHVSSTGIASGTTVNSGGSLGVSPGGIANDTTVDSGTYLLIRSGGTATEIKEDGGYVSVEDGATATFVSHSIREMQMPSGHSATVHSGTTAISTVVNAGKLYVYSGGIASSVFINSAGYLYVFSGGTASSASVNLGSLYVYSGGCENNTIINSAGYQYISSGGTATDTTVNSGGRMAIASGAVLAGHNDIGGTMTVGGSVNASAAIIDFAVNQRTTKDIYMISNMAYLNGATYCITVSEEQNAGTYQLAEGAKTFTGTITVQTESGKVAGDVSVGGTVKFFDANYTLQRSYSTLYLVVSYDKPTYVNNAWEDLVDETVVEVPGSTAIIGTDAFADEATARAKVGSNANLTILGTQSGNLELSGTSNELQNMVIGGTVSTGTATNTPQNTQIAVTDTSAKRMFAGGKFNEVTQTGTAAEVTAIVSGGSFGGVFGGSDIANSKVLANTNISISGSTSGLVFGGSNLKVGTASTKNTTILNGDTVMTLTGATSSQYTCGGSLVGSYSSETRTGDITMTIDGGSFQQLVGGTLIQSNSGIVEGTLFSKITGNINISVSGAAKIGALYGGSMALKVGATRKETIVGNVNLTVDVSEGAAVSGMVFCGGAAYMSVDGDTNLTVKGTGKGSDFFGATVISCDSAYANWGSRYVSGDCSLSFSNFNGRCQSNIYLVDTINVDATSEVTLTYLMSNLNGVNWNISADDTDRVSVTLAESTLGEFAVDLAGSAMNLSCELGDGDEWTVFKTAGSEVFSNLGNADIYLNGDFLTETDTNLMTGETYQLEYREDGALVASKLA